MDTGPVETFVLRLWGPSPGQPSFQMELHGIVDHVASGERIPFTNEQGLLEAIHRLRGTKPAEIESEGGGLR